MLSTTISSAYPKSGPHAPTDTFSKIMLENGVGGRREAMRHVEQCHPAEAKTIYDAIREDGDPAKTVHKGSAPKLAVGIKDGAVSKPDGSETMDVGK